MSDIVQVSFHPRPSMRLVKPVRVCVWECEFVCVCVCVCRGVTYPKTIFTSRRRARNVLCLLFFTFFTIAASAFTSPSISIVYQHRDASIKSIIVVRRTAAASSWLERARAAKTAGARRRAASETNNIIIFRPCENSGRFLRKNATWRSNGFRWYIYIYTCV